MPKFFCILIIIFIIFLWCFDNISISLKETEYHKTSTSITVSTQNIDISNNTTKVISISQDGGEKINEFIITSTNGVFLRDSYPDINFLGDPRPSKKICALEKGTKINILQLKRIPNNELWYKIHIKDRGEEYKDKKTIKTENPKTETTKTETTKTESPKTEITKTKTIKTESPKTEITQDMSTKSREENCPLIITKGWIIGQYGNNRKTINVNIDEKESPDELVFKKTFRESLKFFLFKRKFYKGFPMTLGILLGFASYYLAKSGENSSLFWQYLRTKGLFLFFVSLFCIIFANSYNARLDWFSRHKRFYDQEIDWGILGKAVQDVLNIFFNIHDFWGNVAAGLILTLLFLNFFPMNKD